MDGDGAEAQRQVGASAAPDANQSANAAPSEPTGEKRKRHIHDDNERRQRRDKAYPDKKGGKTNRSKAKSRKEYNAGTDGKRARIDASRMRSSQRSDRSVAIHATQFSKEEIEAEERKPKRKVAVMIGYAGTGYHGMQMSHKLRTIEGDLFQAFVKAGAVSKANADDPKKLSFVRCARTDKGVHAAGNIISLKLVIEDPDIVAKINEHLVPQIRVWGIERTLNGFSAHTNVDSRVYEYLIPTHCFLPPHPKSFLASWLAGHAEETGDREAWLERQKDVADFWNRAHEEYVKPVLEQLDPALRDSAWEKIFEQDENEVEPEFDEAAEGKAVDADEADDAEADDVGEAGAETKEQVEDTAKSKKQSHEMTPIEEAQKKLKTAMMAAKKAWRIGPERLARLKQVLSRFEGVKNFHNYTVRVSPTDPSTTRIIKSFVVSGEPFVINDTEWISMKVHGQSFMMHQIRKMVGMAANVVRCGTHEGRFQDSWELNRLSIPRAPGLGLLLERPIFDGYNKKIQTQQGGAERNDVTFVPYEKEIQEFKQREIYDRIHREEAKGNHFHQLFWSIDNLPRSQFLYLSSKGMAALQGEWRGKRMSKYKGEAA